MPTTADYLNDLVKQKESLVEALTDAGVEASSEETFSTLVPKSNAALADFFDSKSLIDKLINEEPFDFHSNSITELCTSVFAGTRIRSVSLPECTEVRTPIHNNVHWGIGPFVKTRSLKSVYLPKCTKLGGMTYYYSAYQGVFVNCDSLTTLSLPECTVITPSYAISNNQALKVLDLPKLKTLPEYNQHTFAHNTALESVNFPELEFDNIGWVRYSSFFVGCTALTTVSLAKTKYIPHKSFENLASLSTVYAPLVQGIGVSAFSGCSSLTEISFPECIQVDASAFNNCKQLSALTLATNGSNISIDVSALKGCGSLKTIILDGILTSAVTFSSCPLDLETAKRIINCLENYAGTENQYAYKVTFSSTTLSYLRDEGATAPGGITWTDYVDRKGWNI